MEQVRFEIQGSAPLPYVILFTHAEKEIIATCSCPAGENGLHCKHRLGILTGSPEICHGLSDAELTAVRSWLPGSRLAPILLEMAKADSLVAAAQKAAKSARKKVAAAMLGRF